MKRSAVRSEGIRKTDAGIELAIGPNLLIGILGCLAFVAVIFVGIAIGRRVPTPAASVSTASQPAAAGASQPILGVTVVPQTDEQQSAKPVMNIAANPPKESHIPVSEQRKPIGDEPRLAVPELESASYIFGFGKISPNDKVSKTFTIKNIGRQPLEISGTYNSCGCTSTVVSDKTVAPGGETAVKVEFDPRTESMRNQTVTRWFIIKSNDPTTPDALLTFTADVGP